MSSTLSSIHLGAFRQRARWTSAPAEQAAPLLLAYAHLMAESLCCGDVLHLETRYDGSDHLPQPPGPLLHPVSAGDLVRSVRQDLPLHDHSTDFVVSLSDAQLECLPATLEQVRRVLRRDGTFIAGGWYRPAFGTTVANLAAQLATTFAYVRLFRLCLVAPTSIAVTEISLNDSPSSAADLTGAAYLLGVTSAQPAGVAGASVWGRETALPATAEPHLVQLTLLRRELEEARVSLIRERRASEWRDAMLRAEILSQGASLAPATDDWEWRKRIELHCQLIQLLSSMSWRVTAPLRMAARRKRGHGHADVTPSLEMDSCQLQGLIDAVQTSRSWRVTAPLRRATGVLGKLARPYRAAPLERAAVPPADDLLRAVSPARGILVAADTLPLHDRSSGGLRLHTLIDMLLRAGEEVTFASWADRQYHDQHLLPGRGRERYERDLQALGVSGVLYGMDEVRAALSRSEGLKAAFVSFPVVARDIIPAVRMHAPDARIIYDMVDFHALRMEREAELNQNPELLREAAKIKQLELANVDAADVTVAITDDERLSVLSAVPKATVETLPNVFRMPEGPLPGLHGRDGLLFVGGFWHKPNGDAIVWFAREVWPLIRAAEPDARLRIAGNAPGEDVRALGALPGIEVLGYVQDLRPLYDTSRVSIAPLRFGAGMKGKVGQAMAYGLPVVATPIGAEGMDLKDGRELLVAETVASFADAVLRLMRDDALWLRMQASARTAIESNLSFDVVAARLEKIIRG